MIEIHTPVSLPQQALSRCLSKFMVLLSANWLACVAFTLS